MAIFVLDTFYTYIKYVNKLISTWSTSTVTLMLLINSFSFTLESVNNYQNVLLFSLQCLGSLDMQDLSDSQMSDENGVER